MYTKRYKLRVDRDREESVELINELIAEGAARAPATVLSLRLGRESALTGLLGGFVLNVTCELRVRVEPAVVEPFETTFTQILVGDMVGLLRSRPDALEAIYDPARPPRIALDVVTYRQQLREAVTDMVAQNAAWQQGGGVAGAVEAARAAAPKPPVLDPGDQLRKLEELRAAGTLSEAQFELAKQSLGGR
jgi:hypothetical protein